MQFLKKMLRAFVQVIYSKTDEMNGFNVLCQILVHWIKFQ